MNLTENEKLLVVELLEGELANISDFHDNKFGASQIEQRSKIENIIIKIKGEIKLTEIEELLLVELLDGELANISDFYDNKFGASQIEQRSKIENIIIKVKGK